MSFLGSILCSTLYYVVANYNLNCARSAPAYLICTLVMETPIVALPDNYPFQKVGLVSYRHVIIVHGHVANSMMTFFLFGK